jgi:hypothetical protein
MPKVIHGKYKTAVYIAWNQNRVLDKLDPRWNNFEDMYKDVGEPPGEGMRVTRLRKHEVLGPDNWRWRLNEGIKKGQFRDTVYRIIHRAQKPITAHDVRVILIEEYGEPKSLLRNTVHMHCVKLVEEEKVARTDTRSAVSEYGGGSTKLAYGYFVPINDARKILWVIRNPDFKLGDTKPDRIIYNQDYEDVIRMRLCGVYPGVDRMPLPLKGTEYYESKGWRVIEC